jgi:hypothetical protein
MGRRQITETEAQATLWSGRTVRTDAEWEITYQSGSRAGETTLHKVRDAATGRWVSEADVRYITR